MQDTGGQCGVFIKSSVKLEAVVAYAMHVQIKQHNLPNRLWMHALDEYACRDMRH